MSILVNKSTRVIVQGLTGREGTFHAKAGAEYGTQIVGGVTPGKGGTTYEGWPIFNTVQEAVDKTAADASASNYTGTVQSVRARSARVCEPNLKKCQKAGIF